MIHLFIIVLIVFATTSSITSKQPIIIHPNVITRNETVNSTLVYVVWLCFPGWDEDFIHEFFPPPRFRHIYRDIYYQYYHGNSSLLKPKVMVYNIENSRKDEDHDDLVDLVTTLKPSVLVHLSDEYQGDTKKKWRYRLGSLLYSRVPLAVRSHSVFPYRSYAEPRLNVYQLPLGYMSGMLRSNDTVPSYKLSTDVAMLSLDKKSADREFTWAFIGGVRGHVERGHMLKVFYDWKPYFHDAGLTPTEMLEKYKQSKFVLVGRGLVNIDCFRIYEAIIAGAIPIVVSPSPDEIRLVFEHEGDRPPLFFASDFETALNKSRGMSDRDIDVFREELVHWYVNRMATIKRRIVHYTSIY